MNQNVAIVFLILSTMLGASPALTQPSNTPQELIQQFRTANAACRGSNDESVSKSNCERRGSASAQLEGRGYCLLPKEGPPSTQEWKPCTSEYDHSWWIGYPVSDGQRVWFDVRTIQDGREPGFHLLVNADVIDRVGKVQHLSIAFDCAGKYKIASSGNVPPNTIPQNSPLDTVSKVLCLDHQARSSASISGGQQAGAQPQAARPAATPMPQPPSKPVENPPVGSSDSDREEAALEQRAEKGDLFAARALAQLWHGRGDPQRGLKYSELADAILYESQSTPLNVNSAFFTASEAEPAYVDLRAAIRDMHGCRSLRNLAANRFGIAWNGEDPDGYNFGRAAHILTEHAHARPDFQSKERFKIDRFDVLSEIIDNAFPTASGVVVALDRCRQRFDALRPMLRSYSIDGSRREQCIKAFFDQQLPVEVRFGGVKDAKLFAIFPEGVRHLGEVFPRPSRVQFFFEMKRTMNSFGQSYSIPQTWVVRLVGDCPTKL